MELLTTGQLARRLDAPRQRVNYAIERARIQEYLRAGVIRLFASEQLPAIAAAVDAIKPYRVRQDVSEGSVGGTRTAVDRAVVNGTPG